MKIRMQFPVGSVVLAVIVSSCAPMNPGGLSDAEWNSLSPAKRAELTIAEEQASAARVANVERSMERAERQRQFDEVMHSNEPQVPTVNLSQDEINSINSLTNKSGKKKK